MTVHSWKERSDGETFAQRTETLILGAVPARIEALWRQRRHAWASHDSYGIQVGRVWRNEDTRRW